jgi:hypothetical protein
MSRSILATIIVCSTVLAAAAARADTLEQYSQKCDAATGATVPDFDCDAGTLVPDTHQTGSGYPNLKCDRPNVLNHECDPGSRFQVLVENDNASIVAHCRKKIDTDDGKYGDIAVIQYGKKNGATCFYQALGRLDPKVQAPSKGTSAWPWFTPARTAGIHCGECHDNGPFIRSPYIAQLKDIPGNTKNVLPGSHDGSYNSTQPYAWVGDDFSTWKSWTIEISGNTCNDCHRMAVTNLAFHDVDPSFPAEGGGGTARVLGINATGMDQVPPPHTFDPARPVLSHKNKHDTQSPIWMTPGQNTFDQGNFDAAMAMRACALKFVANKFNTSKPLPAGCTVKFFAGAYKP